MTSDNDRDHQPALYWVDTTGSSGRIVITRRPRGFEFLDVDVASWRVRGVDIVVSLLDVEEAARLGLGDQAAVCRRHGIEPVMLPVADFSVPPVMADAMPILDHLTQRFRDGQTIAFHCYASRGRSPTFAAAVMVNGGLAPDDAIRRIARARGHDIPETAPQRQWIFDVARVVASRDGAAH